MQGKSTVCHTTCTNPHAHMNRSTNTSSHRGGNGREITLHTPSLQPSQNNGERGDEKGGIGCASMQT